VARIVVAGAGAVGASIAYHLALLGADDVVLADASGVATGSTGKAMGGVRQQFSTEAEVSLARDSIQFFEELGPEYFHQVGYLFVAMTEDGLAELEARRELQAGLGVPVERVDRAGIEELAPGTNTDDVLGGVFCQTDGVADPPVVTREIVRRAAERGVEVRERTRAEELEAGTLVIACGAWSAEVASGFGVELPIRPLCRQLFETEPLADLPADLPMVIEAESGFHYRRRDKTLRIAMPDPELRWGFEETVDESLFPDGLARLAHRFPATSGTGVARAWAGLYDMTPDAHPIVDRIGDGLFAACGFSGHGFMQSPAVGRALAEWIVEGAPSADLSPYRLERFAGATAADVETVVL
jgi:sarcosine oxidase, subunit beta